MWCKTSGLRSNQHLVESGTSVRHMRHSFCKTVCVLKQLKSDKPPDVQKIVVESPPAEEEAATVAEGESSLQVPPC